MGVFSFQSLVFAVFSEFVMITFCDPYIYTYRCIRETLALLTCADNSIVSNKLNKTVGSDLEHLPIFKALSGADPKQNGGPIYKFNPEHLLVF